MGSQMGYYCRKFTHLHLPEITPARFRSVAAWQSLLRHYNSFMKLVPMNFVLPMICLLAPLSINTADASAAEDPWQQASVRAIEFLLQAQEGRNEGKNEGKNEEKKDEKSEGKTDDDFLPVGEWPYEGVYRERGKIPPGYRVGGTAIVLRALIESLPAKRVNFKEKDPVGNILLRGFNFLIQESQRTPGMGVGFNRGYDVRDWGHIECLETLLRMEQLEMIPEVRLQDAKLRIQQLIDTLIENEIPGGGWNYSRSRRRGAQSPASPFMTSPAVMALLRAKEMGYIFDGNVVIRALKTIENARLESGSIQYSTQPDRATGKGFEALEGACARMAVSELALFQVGMNDLKQVRFAVEAFFEHWEWLERRRAQTGTHNPPYYIRTLLLLLRSPACCTCHQSYASEGAETGENSPAEIALASPR